MWDFNWGMFWAVLAALVIANLVAIFLPVSVTLGGRS